MKAEHIKTHLFAAQLLLGITHDYKPLFLFSIMFIFLFLQGAVFADRALSRQNICVIKLVHGELPAAAAATAACC